MPISSIFIDPLFEDEGVTMVASFGLDLLCEVTRQEQLEDRANAEYYPDVVDRSIVGFE